MRRERPRTSEDSSKPEDVRETQAADAQVNLQRVLCSITISRELTETYEETFENSIVRRYSGGGGAGGAEGGAGGDGDAEPEGVAACLPSAGRSRPVQIDSKSCFTCSGPAPLERTCWQNELHSRMALRNGTFAASSAPSSRCGLKSVTSPLPQQPPVVRRCAVRTVLARGRLGPGGAGSGLPLPGRRLGPCCPAHDSGRAGHEERRTRRSAELGSEVCEGLHRHRLLPVRGLDRP